MRVVAGLFVLQVKVTPGGKKVTEVRSETRGNVVSIVKDEMRRVSVNQTRSVIIILQLLWIPSGRMSNVTRLFPTATDVVVLEQSPLYVRAPSSDEEKV